jgi:RNA polymerase sigma factor (sigma-70 family)
LETLALEYYKEKKFLKERERQELEERIIKASEGYVFAYLQDRPYHVMDDIQQAARIGILNAIRNYDPEKGAFCTWILWQTKNTVNRDKNSHWIKVPAYVKDNVIKLERYLESFPDIDTQILEYFNWSQSMLDRVRDARMLSNSSLEYPEEPSPNMNELDTSIMLRDAMKTLSEEERVIITLVIVEKRSVNEVASMVKESMAYVQEIMDGGLKKLRRLME